jgi:hypothetical protein
VNKMGELVNGLLIADEQGRDRLSKKNRRGLREIVNRIQMLSREARDAERAVLKHEIMELAAAISNDHRNPVPRYVGLPDLPFRFIDSLSNPVARGNSVAKNLERDSGGRDASELDPMCSSFWRRPRALGEADLFFGFGRSRLPKFGGEVWDYSAPKTGGGNPGCELAGRKGRIKVKFAETHSEPFTSRIFHALGYHVEATDFAPEIKIRYDRRFFLEFNSHAKLKMKIGVLFIPIYTFNFQRRYDPFDYIRYAVFKDGSIHSGAELRRFLLRGARRGSLASGDFRPESEAAVDYLVTVPANVQAKEEGMKSIGPWDFAGLGHEDLRELRGAGVVAAWLGWWDARFDNTRLRIVERENGRELRHYFSDLGAGLGESSGTYRHSSEEPNDFTWTFTRKGRGRSIHFPEYEPIEDALAFKRITFDDARWMARLIGQFSEEQIVAALVASGFDSASVRVYTEKLISRRDQLIRDTELTEEVPLLRPEGADRELDYAPGKEGAIRVEISTGNEIIAPTGTTVLRRGRVIEPPRETPRGAAR